MKWWIAHLTVSGSLVLMGSFVWGWTQGLEIPAVIFSAIAGLTGSVVTLVYTKGDGGKDDGNK